MLTAPDLHCDSRVAGKEISDTSRENFGGDCARERLENSVNEPTVCAPELTRPDKPFGNFDFTANGPAVKSPCVLHRVLNGQMLDMTVGMEKKLDRHAPPVVS
jgi:hypothetical protein